MRPALQEFRVCPRRVSVANMGAVASARCLHPLCLVWRWGMHLKGHIISVSFKQKEKTFSYRNGLAQSFVADGLLSQHPLLHSSCFGGTPQTFHFSSRHNSKKHLVFKQPPSSRKEPKHIFWKHSASDYAVSRNVLILCFACVKAKEPTVPLCTHIALPSSLGGWMSPALCCIMVEQTLVPSSNTTCAVSQAL